MTSQNWNTVFIAVAVFVLALFIGFVFGANFSGGCPDLKDAPFGCIEWWLNRYQTLLAMLAAIFLAGFAALPVWRQLKLSSIETTVILNQVLAAREKLLADRAKSELAQLEKLSQDLAEGYHQREAQGSLGHWLWDMEQQVDKIRDRFIERQKENLDGLETGITRQFVITALDELRECMSNFNASQHADGADVEMTPEIEAQIKKDEERAEFDLPMRIDAVSEVIGKLQKAFDADLQSVRYKRIFTDKVLVKAEIL